MPSFIPVPWFRWKRFRVAGVIREQGSGHPLPGLVVSAFDRDVVRDDYLGTAETDSAGRFEIRFTDADFKDALEARPDLYLCVFAPGSAEPIYDTTHAVRSNAGAEEHYEIEIPRAALAAGRRA